MRMLSVLATTLLLALTAVSAAAENIRIGTFHKPSVVIAYYRSPLWAETLRARLAEREAAKKSGDAEKIRKLETWGKDNQDLAHRQLSGDASIDSVLNSLKPTLAEVARSAKVRLIVPDVPFADSSVELVDVTDRILDQLGADDRTRNIIRDLRAKQPGSGR